MSDAAEIDSLSPRLAVGRLSSPGVLDRCALQRVHDRFAPSTRAHLLDRLQRRVTPATPGAESLPLVRIDRSADVEAAPSASVDTASGGVAAGQSTTSAAPTGRAPSVSGNRITRSSPTISPTPAIVARRIADAPGLVGSRSAPSRLFKRSEHAVASTATPLVVAHAGAASPLMQRDDESAVTPRATNAESAIANVPETSLAGADAPHGRGTATPAARVSARAAAPVSPSLLMRKPEASAQSSNASANAVSASRAAGASGTDNLAPTTTDGSLPAVSHHSTSAAVADTGPLTRVTSREPASGSSRLVWRKLDTTLHAPAAPALTATSATPSVSAPPPRLVLRKAVAAATSAGHPSQPPSIATAPASVIARTSDASGAGSQYGESNHAHDWNIEWIADQVGKRLARRLEIERERTGARQWRQAN